MFGEETTDSVFSDFCATVGAADAGAGLDVATGAVLVALGVVVDAAAGAVVLASVLSLVAPVVAAGDLDGNALAISDFTIVVSSRIAFPGLVTNKSI